tara:strand:- start:2007 stop:2882 length:876 start_codon:yes stop_codon:yes gene_type:complete
MAKEQAFLNGRWVDLKNAKVSVLDRSFMLGDGLFESIRSYNKKIFRLDLHLDRLFIGANAIGILLPYSRNQLRNILQLVLEKNELNDAYIRLTVTRGEGNAHHQLELKGPPNLAVIARPYTVLSETFYKTGVAVALFPDTAQSTAGLNIRIKSCNFLSSILLKDRALKAKAFEAILLRGQNRITEGAFSNLFIIKDGELKTPRLNRWVLAGVTRKVVLEIARNLKIFYSETGLTKEDLHNADEAFLTNTRYEVLPVTRADGMLINKGKPGPLTKKLRQAFSKIIEEETLSC